MNGVGLCIAEVCSRKSYLCIRFRMHGLHNGSALLGTAGAHLLLLGVIGPCKRCADRTGLRGDVFHVERNVKISILQRGEQNSGRQYASLIDKILLESE